MAKGANIPAIETATNKKWSEWLIFMNDIDAKNLNHKEIAKKVYEECGLSWWSQAVTVAYEQEIGRRLPGQRNDGSFEISVSKTIDGDMDMGLEIWLKAVKGRNEFNRAKLTNEPGLSHTDKWRYWRCTLDDGTKVGVYISNKANRKSQLAIQHVKIASAKKADIWRSYWKDFVAKL